MAEKVTADIGFEKQIWNAACVLRVICAGLDNDPKKISIHMLEMLVKFRNEGIAE